MLSDCDYKCIIHILNTVQCYGDLSYIFVHSGDFIPVHAFTMKSLVRDHREVSVGGKLLLRFHLFSCDAVVVHPILSLLSCLMSFLRCRCIRWETQGFLSYPFGCM